MPAITVITPTFERWDHIGPTLRGALAQEGVEVEVVIVDDGTTRMPPELLDGAEGRVRHIHPPERRGVGHARNLGIEAADTEWIAFLDDDDLWAPGKLAAQLRTAEAAGSDWVYSGGVHVDDRLEPFGLLEAPDPAGLVELLVRYQAIPAACSNILCRRALAQDAGGFDPALHQVADWDLWLRMADRAPAAAVPDVHVAYVQHAGSMLITQRDPIFAEYDVLLAKHRELAARHGVHPDPATFGHWVAGRLEEAGERRWAARSSLYAGVHYRKPGLVANAARIALGGRPRGGEPVRPPAPAWLDAYRPSSARASTSRIRATESGDG